MIRTLTIITAIAALAVSASPASAHQDYTIVKAATTPRTLGAANDISHLSLRKAPTKPRLVSHEDNDQI